MALIKMKRGSAPFVQNSLPKREVKRCFALSVTLIPAYSRGMGEEEGLLETREEECTHSGRLRDRGADAKPLRVET